MNGNGQSKSGWPVVEADLRRAMLQAGKTESAITQILSDLRPVWASVERVRGRVDAELTFALLGIACDRARRHCQCEKTRPASERPITEPPRATLHLRGVGK